MKLEGTFKSIPRKNYDPDGAEPMSTETFKVTITNNYDAISYDIIDPTSNGFDPDGHNVYMFGKDPVHITCDRTDLTQHIIISQAQIKLITNEDTSQTLFADTNRSIKVIIDRMPDQYNEYCYNNTGTVFYGYVDPLKFNQGYAHNYEEITVTATDPLGALEDLTMDDLTGISEGDSISMIDFICRICRRVFINDISMFNGLKTYFSRNVDPNSIKVNLSIFYGEDKDSRMTLYEALEEVLKYLGCTISYEPREKVVKLYNMYYKSETYGSQGAVWFDGYDNALDAKTAISMDDVYNKITLTCEIEPVDDGIDLLDNDKLYSDYSTYQKYMTELVSRGEGEDAFKGFKELMRSEDGDECSTSYDSAYKLDHFCYVKRNDAWKFGSNSYIEHMNGTENNGATPVQKKMKGDQSNVLKWLKDNSIKGAFVSFGKTEKINYKDNSPISNVDLTDYLVISVNGHNDMRNVGGHADTLFGYIQDSSPICSYTGLKAYNLTPTDTSVTNYVVISGKIKLNPIQGKTGEKWTDDPRDDNWGGIEGVPNNLYNSSTNTFNETKTVLDTIYTLPTTPQAGAILNQPILWHHTVPYNEDDAAYYQQKWWNLSDEEGVSPMNPEYVQTDNQGIFGNLENSKGEVLNYSYTEIGDDGDKISKLPILACQLKIGNKWCVERLDKGYEGQGVFEWMTDEEWLASELNTKGFGMPYFTIGIDPKPDQKIIGKAYDIQKNSWYYQNIDADGTAIKITAADKLFGVPEFKILGPVMQEWNEIERIHPSFWRHTSWNNHKAWVLELLDSILISDLKIEFMSDNGLYNEDMSNQDNDLLYQSVENISYTEKLDFDLKICTPLTLQECHDKGVKYQISNSYVMKNDNEPFYGWKRLSTTYKPEELLIDYYYKQYCSPARIIDANVVGSCMIGAETSSNAHTYIGIADVISNYIIYMEYPGIETNNPQTIDGKVHYFDEYYCMSMDWGLKDKSTKCKLRQKLEYDYPLAPS